MQPPMPPPPLGGSGPIPSSGFRSAAPQPVAHVPRYLPAAEQSKKLTQYLKTHRLPLVGAQVTRDASGRRQVLLYGFVATPFGKNDAENKARAVLNDPELVVLNHIKIRPELLTMRAPVTSMPPPAAGTSSVGVSGSVPAATGVGGVQAYEQQGAGLQQYQQYQQQQQQMGWVTTLLPLAAMIGLGVLGGGNVGAYPGYGYYGSSPYGYYGGSGYTYTFP